MERREGEKRPKAKYCLNNTAWDGEGEENVDKEEIWLGDLKGDKKKLKATQGNKITLAKRREIHTDEQDFFFETLIIIRRILPTTNNEETWSDKIVDVLSREIRFQNETHSSEGISLKILKKRVKRM